MLMIQADRLLRSSQIGIIMLGSLLGAEPVVADVLNPTTHASPSGQYELFVDPSAMDGSGPAQYRLTRNGKATWEGEHPFSLWEAKVTDDGTVAGYAYERGVDSGGHHGTGYNGLSIIILASDGQVLLRDSANSHEAKVDWNTWTGDSPEVLDFLVDMESDRFVALIPLAGNEAPTIWWNYRLSTGEKTGDIIPDQPKSGEWEFQRSIFADIVPGTSLILMHEFVSGNPDSAQLGLYDPHGKRIWSLGLAGEYANLGEDWHWYYDLMEADIVQASVGSRSFEFRSYSLKSRLSFTLAADDALESGWSITETARVADHLRIGREETTPPEIELMELEFTGVIDLKPKIATERSPINNIFDFAFDPAGNIGFVRFGDNETTRFVRVSPSGEILSDFELEIPDVDGDTLGSVAPVSNDRWVLVRSSYADGVATRAWWIDVAAESLDPIQGFKAGDVDAVESTGDGGFIVLASHSLEYTSQDEVVRYDSEGKRTWNRRESGYGQGFSFQAVTWLEDVGLVGLVGVSNTLEFFDQRGEHQRSVKLDEILGAEPSYPTGITSDLNGGLILNDFQGTPPIYRIDAGGKVTAQFQPRFPDGRTFGIYGDVQVAPDGKMWTSDGHALLRTNDAGVVDKIIGPKPDDDTLEEIRALLIGPAGDIYVVNARTSAVHVFDQAGKALHICRPLPTDFETGNSFGSITIDGAGIIYYQTDSIRHSGYLKFSSNGERIGFVDSDIDSVTEDWLFKPGSDERWVLGYEEFHLVDTDDKILKTIGRRPNGDWLQNLQDAAVAADGSLAVIASPHGWSSRGPAVLNIYDADGTPRKVIPLTEESFYARIVYNGSIVVTAANDALYLYDLDGGAPRKFIPRVEESDEWWEIYLSPDGTEVWLLTFESMKLIRYKLP